MHFLYMICPARLKVAAIFLELSFFSEHFLAMTSQAIEPIPPARPCCRGRPIRGRASRASTCALLNDRAGLEKAQLNPTHYVGQAFQPDSEPCQAGKPDLLACRTNNFPATRRR